MGYMDIFDHLFICVSEFCSNVCIVLHNDTAGDVEESNRSQDSVRTIGENSNVRRFDFVLGYNVVNVM